MGALQIINEAIKGGKGALSTVRNATRAADEALEAKRLAMEAANPPIKASEAYGQHEGAFLKPIFYDRMKVDLARNKLGGPGFSSIQLVDPIYADAKAVAGVTDKKMGTRILNRNAANVPEGAKVIWTPSVGSLEQHKSNSTMFGEFADIFANQRKNMSAEEIQKLSDRASKEVDNKGRPIFPNGIDLGARNFRQQVKTYDQRALMANIFAGRGVGGEKGRTVPVEELLQKNLDPNMANAGTLDLGNRLFTLEGNVIDRPDLHTDYPKILTGEDLGVNYLPVPIRTVYNDWEVQKALDLAAQGKNRPVTQMDYTKNDPTIQLTNELLTRLQKEGYAEGGAIHEDHPDVKLKAMIDARLGMAEGGAVDLSDSDSKLKAMIDARLGQHMAEGDEPHMGAGGLLNKAIKAIREVPEVSRLDMNFKDVTKRIPELTEAANKLANGELTAAQYDKLVNKVKPVQPYEFVPQPATAEDAMRALTESKRPMFGKTEEMQAGEPADLRLDIPAYKDHGVWVNSIHRKKQPTVYGATSSVKNATMIGSPDKALEVAKGGAKSPFAVIRGEWNPMTEEEAVANAQQYLDHPEWTQVGYDPERHGYFYDRTTMEPVEGAEEVIQIGPLVLAKNPQYGKKTKEKYAAGGLSHFAAGGSSRRKADVTEALTEGLAPMLFGGAKGALASLGGFPGELEQLGRTGLNLAGANVGEEPFLPNTKRVSGFLPKYRGSKVANEVAEMGTDLGENVVGTMIDPMTLIKGAKPVLNAAKMLSGSQSLPATAQAQRGVIKMPGGNWLTGSVEGALKGLKRNVSSENLANYTPEQVAQLTASGRLAKNDALNNWVDRNLTNYVKKQMGTKDDPVRKLADQGILHIEPRGGNLRASAMRKSLGLDENPTAATPLGQAWENRSDSAILGAPYRMHLPMVTSTDEANEALRALGGDYAVANPNALAFAWDKGSDARNLGFDHIVDVLREDVASGRIRPEQLNKVSMEQAVRRVHEYDQEMARKMAETQAKVTEGMPVHKEYPEGYKWIELTAPKPSDVLPEGWTMLEPKSGYMRAQSPDGAKVLGEDMPNLIKNLYQRHPDTPGNPREVLEQALKYEGNTMGHCVGNYCPDVLEGRSRIYSLRDTKGEPHVTVETSPIDNYDLKAAQMKRAGASKEEIVAMFENPPQRIVQIKGKQNRAPKEEYLPFVQDFVKGGNWSDVGDLGNTGLMSIDRVPEKARYEAAGMKLPKYVSERERDELLNEYLRLTVGPPDWDFMAKEYGFPPPKSMKRGGAACGCDKDLNAAYKRFKKGGSCGCPKLAKGGITGDDLIIEERPL